MPAEVLEVVLSLDARGLNTRAIATELATMGHHWSRGTITRKLWERKNGKRSSYPSHKTPTLAKKASQLMTPDSMILSGLKWSRHGFQKDPTKRAIDNGAPPPPKVTWISGTKCVLPPLRCGIMDLTTHSCRWVMQVGDAESMAQFCGRAAPYQPYCQEHREMAYAPFTPLFLPARGKAGTGEL